MDPVTIFSWGYWGWGNSTQKFVHSADAVEAARGFAPPVFVDVRISRSVRAKGFNGDSFRTLIGDARYRHLPSLGNLAVLGHAGPLVQIKDPSQAPGLLDLALQLANKGQRVIFFCSCEFPFQEGQARACHRVTVARLLLESAQNHQRPIEVVEWPGGAPRLEELHLSENAAHKLLAGGGSVPLEEDGDLEAFRSMAWGSVVRIHSHSGEFCVAVGPARYRPSGWFLPVPREMKANRSDTVDRLQEKVRQWRSDFGFEPRVSSAPVQSS